MSYFKKMLLVGLPIIDVCCETEVPEHAFTIGSVVSCATANLKFGPRSVYFSSALTRGLKDDESNLNKLGIWIMEIEQFRSSDKIFFK